MDYLLDGFKESARMLLSLDREVWQCVWVSVKVALTSTVIALVIGLIVGLLLGVNHFKGKAPLVLVLNTLMGLPTVLVGLLVYSLICRRGPLGSLDLLYTQKAMVLGQVLLATPIIAALSYASIHSMDVRILATARTLGAGSFLTAGTVLRELRYPLMAAVIAGFGRVFGEVGISLMVGGNIRFYTRNVTTAIALAAGKGEFALGLALGMVLLVVALMVNVVFYYLRRARL